MSESEKICDVVNSVTETTIARIPLVRKMDVQQIFNLYGLDQVTVKKGGSSAIMMAIENPKYTTQVRRALMGNSI